MNVILRKNDARAQYALWAMLILAIVKVLVIVTYYMQYHLLSQWINGAPIDLLAAEANDRRVLIVAIGDFVVRVGVIVAVICWFRRAYYNLHLCFKNLTYTEGWAAGGWFVPIMSLYVPYQIFLELFSLTKKFLSERKYSESKSLRSGLLLVWWLTWILHNLAENIFSRLTSDETDINKLTNYTLVDIGFAMMSIVALVLFIIIVKSYSEIEPIFHARHQEEMGSTAKVQEPDIPKEIDLGDGEDKQL